MSEEIRPNREPDMFFPSDSVHNLEMKVWVEEEIWLIGNKVYKKYGPWNMSKWLFEMNDGGYDEADMKIVQEYIMNEIIEKELLG